MGLKRYKRLTEVTDKSLEGKTIEKVIGVWLPYKNYSSGLAWYFDDGTYILHCVRPCESNNPPVIDVYYEEITDVKHMEFLDTAGVCDGFND